MRFIASTASAVIVVVCGILYARFRKAGWLKSAAAVHATEAPHIEDAGKTGDLGAGSRSASSGMMSARRAIPRSRWTSRHGGYGTAFMTELESWTPNLANRLREDDAIES
jgi:hypothetical protein